jgi:hypothetical protein
LGRTDGLRLPGEGGFTILEVMVASALTLLVAGGLYAATLMAVRTVHSNRLAIAARGLGVERLEEVAAAGLANIALQAPYPVQTNRMEAGYESMLVTSVDVIGHAADQSVAASLAESAYAEVHVNVGFRSPFTKQMVTNRFSAIVR